MAQLVLALALLLAAPFVALIVTVIAVPTIVVSYPHGSLARRFEGLLCDRGATLKAEERSKSKGASFYAYCVGSANCRSQDALKDCPDEAWSIYGISAGVALLPLSLLGGTLLITSFRRRRPGL